MNYAIHHHHFLEREEQVGKLRNMACHKRRLTSWRGGRGRSRLLSLGTWHVTNDNSLAKGEKEEWVGELGDVA